jgi:hypothetical protein
LGRALFFFFGMSDETSTHSASLGAPESEQAFAEGFNAVVEGKPVKMKRVVF